MKNTIKASALVFGGIGLIVFLVKVLGEQGFVKATMFLATVGTIGVCIYAVKAILDDRDRERHRHTKYDDVKNGRNPHNE